MEIITSFLLWLMLMFHPLNTIYANTEVDALSSLRNASRDPNNVLQSWDSTLVTPCTWFHVSCNPDNRVIRVDLVNSNLSGTLVPQLGQLTSLQYLELYSNNLSGHIPSALGNLTSLVSLDLYSNNLNGRIPKTFGNLTKLRFLRLNNNSLTGNIPVSLTNITTLHVLDLSNNLLSGPVPDTGSFSLFTPISFNNNTNLCGFVIQKPCPGSIPFSPPPPLVPPPVSRGGNSGPRTGAIAGGVAAGAALLFAAPAIWLVWWRRRKPQQNYFDVPAEKDLEVHLGQLKRFSLRELQFATDNFSDKNILGKGGFGNVYKARLADGSLVAVKRLKERSLGGEIQFRTEIETISMAVHPNLLHLLGFSMTATERLLVYPYMENGSVSSCLRERPSSAPPIDWPTRMRIALGSARGLSHLHEHCDPKIIHRDVKASNILLDGDFEAVVGDFGLAKLMDHKNTHVTTSAVKGTIGHIAPEHLSTGKSSEKTDVFGYGIMLLELITGQRTFDLARLANNDDFMLLDWVKRLMKEKKLDMLIHSELENNYTEAEVEQLIQVALLCTQESPMGRPRMSEVVRMLEGEGLAEKWEEWQKVELDHQEQVELDRQESQLPPNQNDEHVFDSTSNLHAVELSGPR